MCHSRHFLWRERDERFEQEVRRLFDREAEKREPPTPVVQHDPDAEPAAEPPVEEVTAAQS